MAGERCETARHIVRCSSDVAAVRKMGSQGNRLHVARDTYRLRRGLLQDPGILASEI